jgi:hypothetical protein
VLFRSILLSAAFISLPLQAAAARPATSEIQNSGHIARVRALIAVNGLGQSNKSAVEGFRQRLLAEVSSEGKSPLTPRRMARFDAISTPICNGILARLDDYTVGLIASRLSPAEVEQLIQINTSRLGAKFISTMTSPESFDHDKFDVHIATTANEIVSALKEERTYTIVSFTYPPGSPAETAKRVFDMTGNRRGLTAAVDDYFAYSMLKAIDADLPLSTMSEDDKLRLKSMIFVGKLSLANRLENHFILHLADHFSHEDLQGLTDLYSAPVVLRASDAVLATQKQLPNKIDSEFKAAKTRFFAKYGTTD